MKTVTRRRFLKGAIASALAGTGLAGLVRFRPSWILWDDPIATKLVEWVKGMEIAPSIGREYLAVHPELADRRRLTESLIASLPPATRTGLASAPVHEFRVGWSEQIRRDFRERKTVSVEGWVLSLTEVRLAALAALCARG